jgi:hypothetical protein
LRRDNERRQVRGDILFIGFLAVVSLDQNGLADRQGYLQHSDVGISNGGPLELALAMFAGHYTIVDCFGTRNTLRHP